MAAQFDNIRQTVRKAGTGDLNLCFLRRHALLALDVPPEAQESGGAELSGGAP
jgi:hypothetical protein